jgi:hypothetical protein
MTFPIEQMSEALISPPILFRFAAPCVHTDERWSAGGIKLDERHRLPCFAELSGKKPFADVRLGWSEQGIAVNVAVRSFSSTPAIRRTFIARGGFAIVLPFCRSDRVASSMSRWQCYSPSTARRKVRAKSSRVL